MLLKLLGSFSYVCIYINSSTYIVQNTFLPILHLRTVTGHACVVAIRIATKQKLDVPTDMILSPSSTIQLTGHT